MSVSVCSIDRFENKGVTEPYIATLSEGEKHFTAFIKLKNNPEGHRCLINELISYRLASSLGVLMPSCGVATINDETKDNTYKADISNNLGNCFFSSQIEMAFTLHERIMKYIENKEIYEKIIMFDHLIYNSDRNMGNLLVRGKIGGKVLYVIDHTHVFKNQSIWDANCLLRGIKELDYNDDTIIESNVVYDLFAKDKCITKATLLAVAIDFKKKCTTELLDSVLKDLPKDWLIDNEDFCALKEYLLYRADHLPQMCEMIIKKKGWKNE